MVSAREVRDLLEERPDLEPALEVVYAVDSERETWTFADVDIDSGSFGELVSRGVVEKHDGEYRLADSEAVRRVLEGTDEVEEASGTPGPSFAIRSLVSNVDPTAALALFGALVFTAFLRSLSFPQVFRERVVLSGNDPYYYRYWVEQLLADPNITLSSLPAAVASGEPLYVATMWLVTSVLGGTTAAAGWVLAWYPIASALLSGILLYLLAMEVTGDRRVALAAVILLAVIPGHALRTSLGFADHHAFDYPWLGVTALSLVVLARAELRTRRGVLAAVGLGVGIAGQVLAWEAGPLLVAPVGLIVVALATHAVNRDVSPLREGSLIVAGLALGALLTWTVHSTLGWHTTLVAAAPLLLLIGSLGVLLVAEGAIRAGLSARMTLGAELLAGVLGVAVFALAFPTFWASATARVTTQLFRNDAIAETQGLFAESAGWLLLFGFVLFVALPYLVWATRRTVSDERWVVPVVYGWAFFALAAIQVRFVGEFGTFAAFFAGLGFVHLAERVDLTRLPKPLDASVDGRRLSFPSRRQTAALLVLFLLVGGLGLVQVPVKINQITITDGQYETAMALDSYSEREGLEYPQNYVHSDWGRNRMYNYFVSGESRSYRYAQDRFDDGNRSDADTFVEMTDPDRAYEMVADRPGFLVLNNEVGTSARSMHTRLFDNLGSSTGETDGLGRYRMIAVSKDESYKTFRIVPGATLTGPAEGESVRIQHEVEVGDDSFDYERVVPVRAGAYQVVIPYPGKYTVGGRTVTVDEEAIESGGRVSEFDGPGLAYWSFDENEGNVAFDRWSGYNAELSGGKWISGSSGPARSLEGDATAVANLQTTIGPEDSLTIDFRIRGNLTATGVKYPNVLRTQGEGFVGVWARQPGSDFGVRFDDSDGNDVRLFVVEQMNFDEWTRFTAVLDRERDELRLYRSGELVGTRDASSLGRIQINQLTFGSDEPTGNRDASVDIDEMQIYREALSPTEVGSRD